MLKKRFLWADIVRIIAIFFVLAGHSATFNDSVNFSNVIDLVSFSIYKTCVPLFVMLSGALLLTKRVNGYTDFIKKRLSRYLPAWLFWSVVTALTFMIGKELNLLSFISQFKSAILSFWFLPMLTCLYLLTPIIIRLVTNLAFTNISLLLFLWFLAVSLLPFTVNSPAFPLYIDNSLLTQTVRFFGYFVFGYYLTKYKFFQSIRNKTLTGIFLLGLVYSVYMTLNRNGSGELYFSYHSPGIVLESVCAFLLIKKITEKHKDTTNRVAGKLIVSLSTVSLGIYLVHLIIKNNVLSAYGFPFNFPLLPSFFNGSILFVISYIVIIFLEKVPFIRKIVK